MIVKIVIHAIETLITKINHCITTYKVACINIKGRMLCNKLQPHLQSCSMLHQFMNVYSNVCNNNNDQYFDYMYKVLDHILICYRNT